MSQVSDVFMWSVLVVYGDWLAFGTKLKSIRGAAGLSSSLLAIFQPQWLLIGYWLFTKYCGLYQLLPNLYILPQVSRHLLIPPICTVESSKMSTLLWSFHSSSCRHFSSFKVNMKDSDVMLQISWEEKHVYVLALCIEMVQSDTKLKALMATLSLLFTGTQESVASTATPSVTPWTAAMHVPLVLIMGFTLHWPTLVLKGPPW